MENTTIFDLPDGPMFTIFDFMYLSIVKNMISEIYFNENYYRILPQEQLINDDLFKAISIHFENENSLEKIFKRLFLTKDTLKKYVNNLFSIFQTCRYFRSVFERYSKINSFVKSDIFNINTYDKKIKTADSVIDLYEEEITFLAAPKTFFFRPYLLKNQKSKIFILNLFIIDKTDISDQRYFHEDIVIEKLSSGQSLDKEKMIDNNSLVFQLELEKLRLPDHFTWQLSCPGFDLVINITEIKNENTYEESQLEYEIYLDFNDKEINNNNLTTLNDVSFIWISPEADHTNKRKNRDFSEKKEEYIQVYSKKILKNLISAGFKNVDEDLLTYGRNNLLQHIENKLKNNIRISKKEINDMIKKISSIL